LHIITRWKEINAADEGSNEKDRVYYEMLDVFHGGEGDISTIEGQSGSLAV
jgi:hypothetical protein